MWNTSMALSAKELTLSGFSHSLYLSPGDAARGERKRDYHDIVEIYLIFISYHHSV